MSEKLTEQDLDALEGDNNPEATKVQEENAAEIEKELAEPFSLETEEGKVEQYNNYQKEKIKGAKHKVAEMFGLDEFPGVNMYTSEIDNLIKECNDDRNGRIAGGKETNWSGHEYSKAIFKLAQAGEKIEKDRLSSREVLSKREQNERQKRIVALEKELDDLGK